MHAARATRAWRGPAPPPGLRPHALHGHLSPPNSVPSQPLDALPPTPPTAPQLLKGNTFAGSAFFSYGSFWIAWAFINTMTRLHGPTGFTIDNGFKVGQCIMLATWGCFTFGFFIPTLRKNACLMVVFGSLSVTFWLLAAGVFNPVVNHAAGYVGAFCGLSAIYTAFAEIYDESLGIRFPGLAPVRFI
jgi:succinate-acetate transporter protein